MGAADEMCARTGAGTRYLLVGSRDLCVTFKASLPKVRFLFEGLMVLRRARTNGGQTGGVFNSMFLAFPFKNHTCTREGNSRNLSSATPRQRDARRSAWKTSKKAIGSSTWGASIGLRAQCHLSVHRTQEAVSSTFSCAHAFIQSPHYLPLQSFAVSPRSPR